MYAKSFKEGVKIWAQNKSILEDEDSLKKQYPEYADMLINKATECESVTSFGKFVAKHDVAFKVVGGLSVLAGAAFCAYGCLAAGLPLLIVGIFAFGLSTGIGWETFEKVSSTISSLSTKQPQAAGQSVK
ncbi:MAG: hypothetical protein PG981_000507 [Wolbachia endosymbiont of Ctenocephalides orientis wCori]|nr:MAG: hypothetical protein PG981_000507 [Wolbachia endosymbiont of Ctenocephalides orientis wCori]